MIKKIVLIPLTCLLLLSFKSSDEISSKKILKDYWLLEKVSYQDPNMFDRIILFNDVTNLCFEQSLWRFNTSANTGSYAINDLYCSYGKRNISFDISKASKKTGLYDVVLKTEIEGGYANRFKVKITELNKKSMKWSYKVYIDGKAHNINMRFVKK